MRLPLALLCPARADPTASVLIAPLPAGAGVGMALIGPRSLRNCVIQHFSGGRGGSPSWGGPIVPLEASWQAFLAPCNQIRVGSAVDAARQGSSYPRDGGHRTGSGNTSALRLGRRKSLSGHIGPRQAGTTRRSH